MKSIKIFALAILIAASTIPFSPETVQAVDVCQGIELTVTVTNVTTGVVLGSYLGGGDLGNEPQYTITGVAYGSELLYEFRSTGAPAFDQEFEYLSGDYNYTNGPINPNYGYVAPPLEDTASLFAGRYEGACTPSGQHEGTVSSELRININDPTPPDYSFTCGVNQIVQQGDNANYLLRAFPDSGYAPTVSVTMGSDIPGPTMNGSPVILNAGNSYTDEAVISTASLAPSTYTLTFSSIDENGIEDSCEASLQVSVTLPQVDLDFDDLDGPVDIEDGGGGLLSWQTLNADTCTASSNPPVAGWEDNNPVNPLSNPYPSGVTVGPLSGPQTFIFTLQCSNEGGSDSDSVTVNVGDPPVLQPTVDLVCAGTDGVPSPTDVCNLAYNTFGTLSWEPAENALYCTMAPDLGAPIGTSNPGISTSNLTSEQDYTITCYGEPGTIPATDTVTFVVDVSTASFGIKCSPKTILLDPGDSSSYLVEVDPIDGFDQEVTLSGVVQGDDGSNDYPSLSFPTTTGTPAVDFSPVISTTADTPGATYTISFTVEGGGITRSCDVELEVPDGPGGGDHPAPKVNADNDNCGIIEVTWTNPKGVVQPDSFNVYRRASSKDSWDLVNKVGYQKDDSLYLYTDAEPLNPTSSNYYAVMAIYSDGESDYANASPSPIVPLPCSGNLTKSDKDVIRVSGQTKKSFSAKACNGLSDIATLPNNALFAPEDRVTFQINICNSGAGALTGITITDDLSKNLSDPGEYSSPQNCLVGTPVYNSGAQTVTFKLTDIGPGDVTTQSCSIVFTATVTAPSVVTAALYRFQNIASIVTNELTKYKVITPPYLFSIGGGVPDRTETAP